MDFVEFRVTLDGQTFDVPDDLTLEETVSLEKTLDCSWFEIQPVRSAQHCQAVLITLLARTLPWDEAAKHVGSWTQAEAIAKIEIAQLKTEPDGDTE